MDVQALISPLKERIAQSGIANPRIAVLVSGVVYSSVVVHLLCEAGYRPTLFYIQIGMEEKGFTDCSWEDDLEIVRHLATRYDCLLQVVSLHEEYWQNVVQYTIDTVRAGLTPNPDMMCNKLIKFGCFEEKWGKDFDFIATGHYATTRLAFGKLYLGTAPDPVKDQTDFLAQINFRQVTKLLFPTGHLLKSEVRQIAEEAHLLSAKRKDSQGICFLGKVNYNEFIERALGKKEGLIIEKETGKVLGKHQGYWFHTIGQRKGLGLSGGPWFVVKKNIRRNILLVSQGYDPADQYGTEIEMTTCDFISATPWEYEADKQGITTPLDPKDHPLRVAFKVRHTPDFTLGTLSYSPEKGYHLVSDTPIQGIAPGQYAVLYDSEGQVCFGSGMITHGN